MDIGAILSLAGGVIVVLGFLGAVIGYLMRLSAEIAVHKKMLETTCQDVEAAHDKIRKIDPVVQGHTNEIGMLNTHVLYIREGIDDVKTLLRSRA